MYEIGGERSIFAEDGISEQSSNLCQGCIY